MKIKGNKVKQGIKIKAVGLTEKERKIMKKAIRKLNTGGKKTIANVSRIQWN